MNKISVQDRVYLASLLDNSSHLNISRLSEKTFTLNLGLQRLGDPSLPNWCRITTGVGNIYPSKHKRGMTYNWCVYKTKDIQDVLRAVLPFLKSEKKLIAELMVNFNIATQESIWQKVKLLKKQKRAEKV